MPRKRPDAKSIDDLSADDVDQYPVWAFVNDDANELAVRPIAKIPVRNLVGKIVATSVRLANGREVRALLGNIDLSNPRLTQHFLIVSVENGGDWFHLARYHDHDHDVRGPKALAEFLGLSIFDVFPIFYDIRSYARGDVGSTCGVIAHEPAERLTREEIIALAVR